MGKLLLIWACLGGSVIFKDRLCPALLEVVTISLPRAAKSRCTWRASLNLGCQPKEGPQWSGEANRWEEALGWVCSLESKLRGSMCSVPHQGAGMWVTHEQMFRDTASSSVCLGWTLICVENSAYDQMQGGPDHFIEVEWASCRWCRSLERESSLQLSPGTMLVMLCLFISLSSFNATWLCKKINLRDVKS